MNALEQSTKATLGQHGSHGYVVLLFGRQYRLFVNDLHMCQHIIFPGEVLETHGTRVHLHV